MPIKKLCVVPYLLNNHPQRDYVQTLYLLNKTFDTAPPVNGNEGWESLATDIVGIHDYDEDPARLEQRYGAVEGIPHLFRRERPGGRLLSVEGHPHAGQPLMLSEFGGIAYALPERRAGTWGYVRADTAEELAERYARLLETVRGLSLLAGFCYTQFADTYQEANGLLYADRTPKIPLEEIARVTRGSRTAGEQVEAERRRVETAALTAEREVHACAAP